MGWMDLAITLILCGFALFCVYLSFFIFVIICVFESLSLFVLICVFVLMLQPDFHRKVH